MLTPRQRRTDLTLALLALAGGMFLNYKAVQMAETAGRLAHINQDLLWQWLPVVNTRIVFVWGFAGFLVWLVSAALLWERRRVPYIIWSFALLAAVRAFFVILTPMNLPPEAVRIDQDLLFSTIGRYMTFRYDLFFSGHTALPFMAFLLFRHRWIRLSFLSLSLTLAAAVLLGRLHYSIDVFAAYFITYALHKADVRWFQPGYRAWRSRWVPATEADAAAAR